MAGLFCFSALAAPPPPMFHSGVDFKKEPDLQWSFNDYAYGFRFMGHIVLTELKKKLATGDAENNHIAVYFLPEWAERSSLIFMAPECSSDGLGLRASQECEWVVYIAELDDEFPKKFAEDTFDIEMARRLLSQGGDIEDVTGLMRELNNLDIVEKWLEVTKVRKAFSSQTCPGVLKGIKSFQKKLNIRPNFLDIEEEGRVKDSVYMHASSYQYDVTFTRGVGDRGTTFSHTGYGRDSRAYKNINKLWAPMKDCDSPITE